MKIGKEKKNIDQKNERVRNKKDFFILYIAHDAEIMPR